jgi:endonuclease/exonuclease/phosphatase (EEP) superfamily protein YafD
MKYFDRLVVIAAIGVAAASALPLLADFWWVFELFCHFRVQYLALLTIIATLLASRRRWRWTAALLPFAAISALPIYSGWPAAERAEDPADQLTVMNVNVNAANGNFDSLLNLVEQELPDLIVLVEMTTAWQTAIETLTSLYPHRIVVPQQDRFGIALLSRLPFHDEEAVDLLTTPAISARVTVAGRSMRIVGVHLRPPVSAGWAAIRNQQLVEIGRLLGDRAEPVLIVGDFNITTYSSIFSRWLEDNELRSAALPTVVTISWPTFLPLLGILIDQFIVSDSVSIDGLRRGPAFGSDHYPLTATLSLRGAQ